MVKNKRFLKLICLMLVLSSVLPSCAKKQQTPLPPPQSSDIAIESGTVTEEITDIPTSDTENKPEETEITIEIQRPVVALPGANADASDKNSLPYADELGLYIPCDVPLSIDDQLIVERVAKQFGITPELVYGVMYVETKYNRNSVGRSAKYLGIMQVAKSNLKILTPKYGITDLMDFEQCVIGGCYFLGHYRGLYGSKNISKILLYYHGGWSYANKVLSSGKTDDAYTLKAKNEMYRIVEARKAAADAMGVRLRGFWYE